MIEIVKKLSDYHQQLLQLSKQKTDLIKDAKSEELVKVLVKERQLIQQIEQVENERESVVNQFFKTKGIEPQDKTVTELLTHVTHLEEKRLLEQSVTSLIEQIVLLREREQLNNTLLQQSMQFVQLTLEMLQPESKNIHYGDHAMKKQASPTAQPNRSVFDSKV